MKRSRRTAVLVVGSAIFTAASINTSSAAYAEGRDLRESTSTVSVLHAIPDFNDGQPVDVYVDSMLLAESMTPGDLATKQMKPGKYELTVVPAQAAPSTRSLLTKAKPVTLKAGKNHTIALHLTPTAAATSTTFTNRTRTVGRDMGLLTIRNIAQAPKVDIRSQGSVLLSDVAPSSKADVGMRSGDYSLRIVRAGTRRALLPASRHRLVNKPGRQDMGDNRIVYLWGSTADGTLDLAVQEVPLGLQ